MHADAAVVVVSECGRGMNRVDLLLLPHGHSRHYSSPLCLASHSLCTHSASSSARRARLARSWICAEPATRRCPPLVHPPRPLLSRPRRVELGLSLQISCPPTSLEVYALSLAPGMARAVASSGDTAPAAPSLQTTPATKPLVPGLHILAPEGRYRIPPRPASPRRALTSRHRRSCHPLPRRQAGTTRGLYCHPGSRQAVGQVVARDAPHTRADGLGGRRGFGAGASGGSARYGVQEAATKCCTCCAPRETVLGYLYAADVQPSKGPARDLLTQADRANGRGSQRSSPDREHAAKTAVRNVENIRWSTFLLTTWCVVLMPRSSIRYYSPYPHRQKDTESAPAPPSSGTPQAASTATVDPKLSRNHAKKPTPSTAVAVGTAAPPALASTQDRAKLLAEYGYNGRLWVCEVSQFMGSMSC